MAGLHRPSRAAMRAADGAHLLGKGGPLALAALCVLGACELDEVSLTEPERILVAEVYLKVGDGPDELSAFLQWTLGDQEVTQLAGAYIRVVSESGEEVWLRRTIREDCLEPELLDDIQGVCFVAEGLEDESIRPGEHLEVQVELPDGRSLSGGVTLPGDFELLQPAGREVCALPPNELLELTWTPAEGAWAYTGETLIWGLQDALRPLDISVEEDSLTLQGISVTEEDTTLVFPKEFGVFDRFDLDRDLALVLQEGLPQGAEAVVVVAALERNYVNWVRGGNFNPSGAVRVPSLRGDGTGVLGAAVRRAVHVVGGPASTGIPLCTLKSAESSAPLGVALGIGARPVNRGPH